VTSSSDEKFVVTSILELLDNGFHAEAGRNPNLNLFFRLEENLDLVLFFRKGVEW